MRRAGKSTEQEHTTGNPRDGWFGILCRFFFSMLLGGVISIVLFVIFFMLIIDVSVFTNAWKHIFWAIPLCWGILGIFYYDRMLDIAAKILESVIEEAMRRHK